MFGQLESIFSHFQSILSQAQLYLGLFAVNFEALTDTFNHLQFILYFCQLRYIFLLDLVIFDFWTDSYFCFQLLMDFGRFDLSGNF